LSAARAVLVVAAASLAVASAHAAPARVQRPLELFFAQQSYRPGTVAQLTIAAGPGSQPVSLRVFAAGTGGDDESLYTTAFTKAISFLWPEGRRRIEIRLLIGDWPSGLYLARLATHDGRVAYAPVVVRPAQLGEERVAVVLPTNTWQAYNFRDDDHDGVPDTWYAHGGPHRVRLDRPYQGNGLPRHFREYDLPFLHWLSWNGHAADFLADSDVGSTGGDALAHAYDLIVFPGHSEYVTRSEYDAIWRYRVDGGNLAFLSADNFDWDVVRSGTTIARSVRWRDLGRPEARLLGVQYRANDRGRRKGAYVVTGAGRAPWLFRDTGLWNGSRIGGRGSQAGAFGVEIDARAPSSPPGTIVLARIPNAVGRGLAAEMTYYTTAAGAKVFAAGAFSLAGAATARPVDTLLENLWTRLSQP
jgi:N,N-dimethylformamidase beta subunit-like, C-terminal